MGRNKNAGQIFGLPATKALRAKKRLLLPANHKPRPAMKFPQGKAITPHLENKKGPAFAGPGIHFALSRMLPRFEREQGLLQFR